MNLWSCDFHIVAIKCMHTKFDPLDIVADVIHYSSMCMASIETVCNT